MARPLIVFEDDGVSRLYPLTLTRPVFDLVCGILSLGDKFRVGLGRGSRGGSEGEPGSPDLRFHMRAYLGSEVPDAVVSYTDLYRASDLLTFINGRLIFCEKVFEKMDFTWVGKYVSGGTVIAATLPKDRGAMLNGRVGTPLDSKVFADLPARPVDACVITYPWDLVNLNGDEIKSDFLRLGGRGLEIEPPPGVFFANQDAIRIAKDVTLTPGVVIDASEGPVNIESGAVVMANASLRGPLHIGPGSVIKMGATIYGETTIGPVCKIGGEVGETIIQGYSNKQHEGFVGHSYLGEWTNLGAGTTTSDMKNNYSTVKVSIDGESVDSGQMFVGLFMGDHSKSGIGTIFNAGTTVGVSCNVYGGDYPPKHIPSFAWGGSAAFEEHDIEAALETARRAMERRGRVFGSRDEAILKKVFELTGDERKVFLHK